MHRVLVVMMMGRWSEPNVLTTLHEVVVARLGEQKVMSGDDGRYWAWWGIWVCWWMLLRMIKLFVCSSIFCPLSVSGLEASQAAAFALKSPPRMMLGVFAIFCMFGV